MNLKSVVAAVLVTAGALAAGAAQARTDVDWSVRINLPLPPLPLLPFPVFVRPAPVYQAPVVQAPVYQAPVYQGPVYSRPVYSTPVVTGPVYIDRDDERCDEREWRERHHRDHRDHREYREHPTRWDVDGDGVPNRYDRRPYDGRRY